MSLMNTGVTALRTNQTALQTISNNIANVNTPGYSRQSVALQSVGGQNMGIGYVGNGVAIETITRNFSALLNRQSNAASATSSADTARYQALVQMQDIFSGGDSSLGAAVNNMMNAFAEVEAAPTDTTARNVVLTRMSELTSRFRSASATLNEIDYSTKQQITNNVAVVNRLAGELATLNGQIGRGLASGHTPNDLQDARDQLIRELNQYVKTSQIENSDGSMSLFIGGSQPLVLGHTASQLSVQAPNSDQLMVYFSQQGGEKFELSPAMIGGGEIAGLLKFKNEDLVEGRNLLGRLSLAIGLELNAQNKRGLTLSGELGSDLFKLSITSDGYTDIPGAREPEHATVTVTDSSKLIASDYRLMFGGDHPNNTKIVRLSDGATYLLDDPKLELASDSIDLSNGDSLAVKTFTLDGLKFSIPDPIDAKNGQSILFQPYAKAANEIQALVHNPADLAVSNAVTAAIPQSNQGTMQLSLLATTDASKIPETQTPIRLVFDATNGYTVEEFDGTDWSDAGMDPGTYSSGSVIDLSEAYGVRITLTGTPKENDVVTIGNAKDLGDGFKLNAGNATAFLALRDAAIFENGTTFSDGYSSAMAVIGARTQSAQYASELSATVAANLEDDRTAVSGVNLDEEAARLLQFQQAYQASAKVIQIAQSLFDNVLNAMR